MSRTPLPLAASREGSPLVEDVDAGLPPEPEQEEGRTFFERTTGDAAWDALWALRGTRREAAEPAAPEEAPGRPTAAPAAGAGAAGPVAQRAARPMPRAAPERPMPRRTVPAPATPIAQRPAEPTAQRPEEPAAQRPAEPTTQPPAEPSAQRPDEPTAERAAEPTVQRAAEPTALQPSGPAPPAETPLEAPEETAPPAAVQQEGAAAPGERAAAPSQRRAQAEPAPQPGPARVDAAAQDRVSPVPVRRAPEAEERGLRGALQRLLGSRQGARAREPEAPAPRRTPPGVREGAPPPPRRPTGGETAPPPSTGAAQRDDRAEIARQDETAGAEEPRSASAPARPTEGGPGAVLAAPREAGVVPEERRAPGPGPSVDAGQPSADRLEAQAGGVEAPVGRSRPAAPDRGSPQAPGAGVPPSGDLGPEIAARYLRRPGPAPRAPLQRAPDETARPPGGTGEPAARTPGEPPSRDAWQGAIQAEQAREPPRQAGPTAEGGPVPGVRPIPEPRGAPIAHAALDGRTPLPAAPGGVTPGPAPVERAAGQDRREALRRAFQPRVVPVVVQAAREEPGEADGAGAAGESTAGEDTEQGEQAPDIDALAREVYQILRRRLQVERERDLGHL
ncbi:MAG: hypothetical protein JXA09_18155 [Anaerolineae bacterium]|nr:hypothetical protein [Anaerolineae bacterium]